MAVPMRANEASVFVDDGEVIILNLRDRDPQLVELVGAAADAEQAVRTVLAVGARVARTIETTADAAIVERRFGELEQRVELGVEKAVELIAATAAQYLDPERGALRLMLGELEQSLGDAFDPQSKASVLAKFEGLLTGGTADLKKVVRDLVDPGNPDSPLGRLRSEVGRDLKEVRQALEQLRTQVAVEQTEADVLDLTAIKGRRFEETVFEATAGFVSLYGDEADAVRDEAGSDGGRCGDILVTLNGSDTPGATARYVLEVKDRKLSLKESVRELERAMKNRDAKAGVLVFADPTKAPIATPLQLFGNKALVVLDKHDPDVRPLQLALAAARCAVQRQLNGVGNGAELEAVVALVEEGQRALACHATIKRCHTTAQRQIASASGEVGALIAQLDDILKQVSGKLRG